MPLIQTDSQHYTDIADAIRDMSGNEDTFYPSEMAAGVRSIPQTIAIQPIIYSLEEREVGVWTDGKPLYQKSFECSINVGSSWVNTNITLENVDKLIHCYGGNKWGSSSNGTAVYNIMADMTSDNKIELCIPGWSAGVKYFTLLYTKTTDTPGSGTWTPSGVPAHHYSTTEQVIGTWIDGKTVYEKTIIGTSIDGGTTVNIAHGIQNVDEFIDCSIFVHVWDNGYWRQLNFAYNNGSTNNNWLGGFALDNTYIYFQLGTLFATTLDKWKAIIRYTKTTD